MNGRLRAGLVRCYPPAWRSRYGAELEALILAADADGTPALRTGLDVLAGAGRERLRDWGLAADGDSPGQGPRSGVLLVLCSWALLVLGGAGVQRFSEHWEDLTPGPSRALPAAAFDGLLLAGVLGCILVAAGIALALPRLTAFLRAGGWSALRRPARVALALTIGLALATLALATWAHSLNTSQRNGADVAYEITFLLWAGLGALTLIAWTVLAVRCARRAGLDGSLLRIEAGLAVAVALAALAATAATALWWGALAAEAPSVLHGRAAGGGSAVPFPLLLDAVVMAAGSLLGLAGARRCARGLRGVARS
jgi:hypothetical protein